MIYGSAINKVMPIVVADCRKSDSRVQFGLRRFEVCCSNTELNSRVQRPIEAAEVDKEDDDAVDILISESGIVRLRTDVDRFG